MKLIALEYVFWKSNTPGWWGDDIAGVVEAVGSKVYDIKKGDRVVCIIPLYFL